MAAGSYSTASTGVNVDVTYGIAWSVTASASDTPIKGFMYNGAFSLADMIKLSNDDFVTNDWGMSTDVTNFMTGGANEDKSGTAYVRQMIEDTDQPGTYSIKLTFTGYFV